jgi:hypothetical protein
MCKQKSPDTVHRNQNYKQTSTCGLWSQQKQLWYAMWINVKLKLQGRRVALDQGMTM